MSENQIVLRKPTLPVLKTKNEKLLPVSVIEFEKKDDSLYSFSYRFDDTFSFKMDETEKTVDTTSFVDVEFNDSIPQNERLYYSVAAVSGILTGAISVIHLSEKQLEKAKDFEEKKLKPFIVSAANIIGYKKSDYQGATKYLVKRAVKTINKEEKTKEIFVSLSEHPTAAGLVFSIIAQFAEKEIIISSEGNIVTRELPKYYVVGETNAEKLTCAVLYWLLALVANFVEDKKHIFDELNIPEKFLNILKNLSNLSFMKNIPSKYEDVQKKFSEWISKLLSEINAGSEENEEDDEEVKNRGLCINILRAALGLAEESFEVMLNECIVYGIYYLVRFYSIAEEHNPDSFEEALELLIKDNYQSKERILSKMGLISSGAFVLGNVSAAALKALKGKETDGRKFMQAFMSELNIAGIGCFVFACVRDSKYWGKDIRVFLHRSSKAEKQIIDADYEDIEDTEAFMPLVLSVEQARLLYSLENQAVKYDIENDKKAEDRNKKNKWLKEWKSTIIKCVGVPEEYAENYFVEDEDNIYDSVFQLSKEKKNWRWFYLLTQELSLFKPYFPLETENDGVFKKLKQTSDYVKDQFVRRQTIVNQAEVDKIVKSYSRYEGYISGSTRNKIISVGVTAAAAVATGGVALTFAPGIAAAIAGEAVAGLHGAALTGASLAFVGGGSLAAGGLGVAGGTAIITGGGALLGLAGSGSVSAAAALLQTPSDFWIRQSAKLLTYCDCILCQNLKDSKSAFDILQLVKKTIASNENKLSLIKAENNDLDEEYIKKTDEFLKYVKRCKNELQKIAVK